MESKYNAQTGTLYMIRPDEDPPTEQGSKTENSDNAQTGTLYMIRPDECPEDPHTK